MASTTNLYNFLFTSIIILSIALEVFGLSYTFLHRLKLKPSSLQKQLPKCFSTSMISPLNCTCTNIRVFLFTITIRCHLVHISSNNSTNIKYVQYYQLLTLYRPVRLVYYKNTFSLILFVHPYSSSMPPFLQKEKFEDTPDVCPRHVHTSEQVLRWPNG